MRRERVVNQSYEVVNNSQLSKGGRCTREGVQGGHADLGHQLEEEGISFSARSLCLEEALHRSHLKMSYNHYVSNTNQQQLQSISTLLYWRRQT